MKKEKWLNRTASESSPLTPTASTVYRTSSSYGSILPYLGFFRNTLSRGGGSSQVFFYNFYFIIFKYNFFVIASNTILR